MEYISHTDYKNLMSKFQAETPKGLLKESLDPVGKEDDDIDNDGDVDKTDKYLHKRRQAVGRAMKEGDEDLTADDIRDAIDSLDLDWKDQAKVVKALDHVDVSKYKGMTAKQAAEEIKDATLDEMEEMFDKDKLKKGLKNFGRNVKSVGSSMLGIPTYDHTDDETGEWKKDKLGKDYDMYDYTNKQGADIDDVEEGLNFPTKQATGQTIMANEDQAPFGLPSLSITEREQLKQCIESYKTIKEEINKLLEKAGKGKMMETKKQKPGGPRTGLVMTSAVTSENEEHKGGEHEEIGQHLGDRLHDAFGKVSKMAVDKLKSEGLTDGEIQAFLQHEIEEVVKGEIGSQYDL